MILMSAIYNRKRKNEVLIIKTNEGTFEFTGNFVIYSNKYILCSSEDIYRGIDGNILEKGINKKNDFPCVLNSLIGKTFDIKMVTLDDCILIFRDVSILCFKEKGTKGKLFAEFEILKFMNEDDFFYKLISSAVVSCYFSYYERYGNVSISFGNYLLCVFCYCKLYQDNVCIFSSYSLRKNPSNIKKMNCLIGKRLLEINKWNDGIFRFTFSNGLVLYIYIDNRYLDFIEFYLRDSTNVLVCLLKNNEIIVKKMDKQYLYDI